MSRQRVTWRRRFESTVFSQWPQFKKRRRNRGRNRWAVRQFLPTIERLEDRRVLASITLTTTTDVLDNDADTSSLTALAATPGSDGEVSLREAIIAANTDIGSDTINLPAGNYARTISNSSGPENASEEGDLDITDTLILTGVGQGTDPGSASIVNGGSADLDRVFHVANGVSVTFQSLTIQSGQAFDDGTSAASSLGGGILMGSGASVTLDNVLLQNNSAQGVFGGVQSGAAGTNAIRFRRWTLCRLGHHLDYAIDIRR